MVFTNSLSYSNILAAENAGVFDFTACRNFNSSSTLLPQTTNIDRTLRREQRYRFGDRIVNSRREIPEFQILCVLLGVPGPEEFLHFLLP